MEDDKYKKDKTSELFRKSVLLGGPQMEDGQQYATDGHLSICIMPFVYSLPCESCYSSLVFVVVFNSLVY